MQAIVIICCVSVVVGWYRVHGDVISKPQLFAIMHDSSLADDLGTVGIRDYHCRRLFQLSDGYGVTVAEMLMRDKDIVSLEYFAVIGHRLQLGIQGPLLSPCCQR